MKRKKKEKKEGEKEKNKRTQGRRVNTCHPRACPGVV